MSPSGLGRTGTDRRDRPPRQRLVAAQVLDDAVCVARSGPSVQLLRRTEVDAARNGTAAPLVVDRDDAAIRVPRVAEPAPSASSAWSAAVFGVPDSGNRSQRVSGSIWTFWTVPPEPCRTSRCRRELFVGLKVRLRRTSAAPPSRPGLADVAQDRDDAATQLLRGLRIDEAAASVDRCVPEVVDTAGSVRLRTR